MPDDEQDVGAIDIDVLERIGRRLKGSSRIAAVAYHPEYAPNSVITDYEMGYFPAAVERAYLRIRWFETDDFCIHYSEQYDSGESWDCRWDRHPNDHNTRGHFHPPPEAGAPANDAEYSEDWRDVLARVLRDLDERVQAFWE
ncbi:hypothetical protein G9464_10300 [Halostella sp. JP-L12]|uniref:hypothetical protein n=1 Tax=Halostella TaxID=1843185 RepID=UPI000EF78EDD|nr:MULTISPECIES: hypothetical protein [Halostella]NHN47986.1 hypothetical protein [Halostella sp. JP-L12]